MIITGLRGRRAGMQAGRCRVGSKEGRQARQPGQGRHGFRQPDRQAFRRPLLGSKCSAPARVRRPLGCRAHPVVALHALVLLVDPEHTLLTRLEFPTKRLKPLTGSSKTSFASIRWAGGGRGRHAPGISSVFLCASHPLSAHHTTPHPLASRCLRLMTDSRSCVQAATAGAWRGVCWAGRARLLKPQPLTPAPAWRSSPSSQPCTSCTAST